MDNLGSTEALPDLLNDFKEFQTSVPREKCAGWKGLGKGGAAKQHDKLCTCYDFLSHNLSNLTTPDPRCCGRWCSEHANVPGWNCYHKVIATPEWLDSLRTDVEELQASLNAELESEMVVTSNRGAATERCASSQTMPCSQKARVGKPSFVHQSWWASRKWFVRDDVLHFLYYAWRESNEDQVANCKKGQRSKSTWMHSVVDDTRTAQWNMSVQRYYRHAIILLRQKRQDFTNAQIAAF